MSPKAVPVNLPLLKIRTSDLEVQDATVVIITRYQWNVETQEWDCWYAKDFVWQQFQPYEVLDTTNITFPGHRIQVVDKK